MGFRYIGSKARVVNNIMDLVGPPGRGDGAFVDAFCGTGVVAGSAAAAGWPVRLNDQLQSCLVIAQARLYAQGDVPFAAAGGYGAVIDALNALPLKEGYFWREYSPASSEFGGVERKYFSVANAQKIDAIRETIRELRHSGRITEAEHTLLLADLIGAVNDVANIAGTYGCFLSKWTSQAARALTLVPRNLREHPCDFAATRQDVFDLHAEENDVVYYDPPYTKRQYAAYYHIPETLAEEDEPRVEGVSGLRPWKHLASPFCYKVRALGSLRALVENTGAAKVLISYSNEGHIQLGDLVEALGETGQVTVHKLFSISRYRPNKQAAAGRSEVKEYLIEYIRNGR